MLHHFGIWYFALWITLAQLSEKVVAFFSHWVPTHKYWKGHIKLQNSRNLPGEYRSLPQWRDQVPSSPWLSLWLSPSQAGSQLLLGPVECGEVIIKRLPPQNRCNLVAHFGGIQRINMPITSWPHNALICIHRHYWWRYVVLYSKGQKAVFIQIMKILGVLIKVQHT